MTVHTLIYNCQEHTGSRCNIQYRNSIPALVDRTSVPDDCMYNQRDTSCRTWGVGITVHKLIYNCQEHTGSRCNIQYRILIPALVDRTSVPDDCMYNQRDTSCYTWGVGITVHTLLYNCQEHTGSRCNIQVQELNSYTSRPDVCTGQLYVQSKGHLLLHLRRGNYSA